jgi:GT2 family glycosyltransferase/glycosyltransferase involved in cell wall biosynthesis
MLRHIRHLYLRYVERHGVVINRPRALYASDRTLLGYAEKFKLRGNKIEVTGWTVADRVDAEIDGISVSVAADINRGDVTQRLNIEWAAGFAFRLPLQTSPASSISLKLHVGEHQHLLDLTLPGRLSRVKANLKLMTRFIRDVVPILPVGVHALFTGDPWARGRVRDALGLGVVQEVVKLSPGLISVDGPPKPAPKEQRVTIILPVYNAFDLLPEVLGRVVRHTDLQYRLVVVEDASPDPRVRPWLRQEVAALRETGAEVTLLENDPNLGFIRSVNKGFALAREHPGEPVVLLNSDAFVPADWASRLVAPILSDPKVATVTPMSNDAEIYSLPSICRRTVLEAGQGDAIDAAARGLSAALPPAEAPTGVGFCMAMNPAFLEKIPNFDTVFGRGYGEEVDWCRRVAALGGRHLGLPSLFVEHRGGESFGSEEKLRLVQRNNAVIESRYPGYDRAVQSFISEDPLLTPRLALALAWADSLPDLEEVPVFVVHSMGGGVEFYLQDRIKELSVALVLRLGGPLRYRLELVVKGEEAIAGATADRDVLLDLVHRLHQRRVVYACAVGDPEPVTIPDLLISLAGDRPLNVEFHDFLPISPSYTLLDSDGVYRGLPRPPQADRAHQARQRDGSYLSLASWQEAWGRAVLTATEVTVFSRSSRELVAAVWPEARIKVRPHRLLQDIPHITPPPPEAPAVLGVLGNIGAQKGAAVVSALSRTLRPGGLVLVGNMDPAFPLPPSTPITGTYALDDLESLAARYGVTAWLIPSVWPETFSYTTHEAIATGLPVIAFDLGAQGEAVRQAPNGVPVPFEAGKDHADAVLAALASTSSLRKVSA